MNQSLILRWLILWLLMGSAMRLFFLSSYPADASLIGAGGLLIGVFNDALAFVFALGLVALLGFIQPRLLRPGMALAMAIAVLVFIAEIFFWLEFEGRLDRLIFHYLAYPREVLVFLQDQFYLSWFALPFAVLVWGLCHLVGWPRADVARWRHAVLALLALGGLFWFNPWQPAYLSESRIASAFVNNGYLSVLEAARYDVAGINWLAGSPLADAAHSAALPMHTALRAQFSGKRHVLLIIEESFAGEVWRKPQMRQKYLPNFVELEANSLSFTNLYASGSRTTRGMEALLNGFPPLPGISTTERANFQRLPSLPRVLREVGYHTAFVYGGWPGFSNFSNYWQGIGFQSIWSRDDFNEEFETSWGVSDAALFERVLSEMSNLTQQHERVFLSTLTVSHHRPYDFPPGLVPWSAAERRSAHAMAYADQSLGDFMRQAQQQVWFDDTIFVVVADHGPHPRGDAMIPVDSFRIPLLIYSAGVTPRQFEAPGSSVSLPRTILDMLNLPVTENFSGASLLCECATPVPVEYDYHIGLLEGDRLNVITRGGHARSWHYNADDGALTPTADSSQSAELQERVLTFFAPAYRWFYELP